MAEKEIMKSIQKAIKETLPEEVGNVLRGQLEMIPELEGQLASANDEIKYYRDGCENKARRVRELESENIALKTENDALKKEADAVQQAKRDMMIEIAEIKMHESEKRAEGLHVLVSALFNNQGLIEGIASKE